MRGGSPALLVPQLQSWLCKLPVPSCLHVLHLGMAGISSLSHGMWWSWTHGRWGDNGATGEPGGGLLAGSSSGVAGWMDEEICGLVRCCWRGMYQEVCGGLAQGEETLQCLARTCANQSIHCRGVKACQHQSLRPRAHFVPTAHLRQCHGGGLGNAGTG